MPAASNIGNVGHNVTRLEQRAIQANTLFQMRDTRRRRRLRAQRPPNQTLRLGTQPDVALRDEFELPSNIRSFLNGHTEFANVHVRRAERDRCCDPFQIVAVSCLNTLPALNDQIMSFFR